MPGRPWPSYAIARVCLPQGAPPTSPSTVTAIPRRPPMRHRRGLGIPASGLLPPRRMGPYYGGRSSGPGPGGRAVSSSKQQTHTGSAPSPQGRGRTNSLFIIYERGQDDGGKTAAMLSEAHARPQAFIDASYISAAVRSSAVDEEYLFSKISPPEPPAPLTLPEEGSYSPTCCALPFHDQ